jgi:DNA-binding transcriptional MerR regulator
VRNTTHGSKPLLGASGAARRLGVTTQCISDWARAGKLAVVVRTERGVRLYDPAEVERLRKARGAARNGRA